MKSSKFKNARVGKQQAGFTLIEMLVVSVITVLAITALVAVIQQAREGSKISTEAERLNLGFEKALQYTATSATTAGFSNSTLIRAGGVPADAVGAGNTIITKFGGVTTYAPASLPGGTNNAIQATQTMLNESACLNFVKQYGSVFTRVSVNGTIVKDVNDLNVVNATLEAQCANNAAGNTVIWTKRKM